VGSRLVKVIDHHSKRIDARRRFHVTVRLVTRLVLVSIACSWLFLYLDSVHQRRRAESLFADLKSLRGQWCQSSNVQRRTNDGSVREFLSELSKFHILTPGFWGTDRRTDRSGRTQYSAERADEGYSTASALAERRRRRLLGCRATGFSPFSRKTIRSSSARTRVCGIAILLWNRSTS
jgi:hypothetical protein